MIGIGTITMPFVYIVYNTSHITTLFTVETVLFQNLTVWKNTIHHCNFVQKIIIITIVIIFVLGYTMELPNLLEISGRLRVLLHYFNVVQNNKIASKTSKRTTVSV